MRGKVELLEEFGVWVCRAIMKLFIAQPVKFDAKFDSQVEVFDHVMELNRRNVLIKS